VFFEFDDDDVAAVTFDDIAVFDIAVIDST